jgi:hypothetical protein
MRSTKQAHQDSGERKVREQGFALSCLDAHNLEETSRSCVAVSPFLTGNPSKGEAQVEPIRFG